MGLVYGLDRISEDETQVCLCVKGPEAENYVLMTAGAELHLVAWPHLALWRSYLYFPIIMFQI